MTRTDPAGTAARTADEILAWSRDRVDPALRTAVAHLPESMRPAAAYHFGWADETGAPRAAGSGKAVRPALVLLSAQAVGGMPGAALPAAVAVELLHNFSLLHDDIMDGDETRRHRPTAWKVFGAGTAILAGDSLLIEAWDVLAASGHPSAREALRVLGAAAQDLIEGQAVDLAFERREEVSLAECRAMAEGKTGALLGCACALGALLGGGGPEQVARLRRFGEAAGLAFQLADDLLGIWGDPAVTGKPVFSDLRNRKKSLPVVAALTSGTAAGRELASLYARPGELTGAELARAARLVDEAGGRTWSRTESAALLDRARGHLHAAAAEPRAAAELETLATLLADRDH
ncbi:family 2 encapsulin nanocompartment cargo protein polyprenyl transferase [Amycolatopsis viridis]|uniref:Geranylgeranyl diphosphate synthase type I n=1 Tax=Amycolatopsis viridis TaxID=185678 RepID=A0ABX0SW00_9PSEU|nr:family 2 encapsulin nanocompartment cargo protein polyprenyl transferase [Amycolatopsis viridis]NIH81146.1 geranylgeranyl diphosphate synthase type I [Amycolatopsis viridis]